MDLNQMDSECPILWIRIDPDLKIIRELQFEQADYNWQWELRYERDILSQFEALEALKKYPSQNTRETLGTVLDSSTCFYRVRIECAYVLTHVGIFDIILRNSFDLFRLLIQWQIHGQVH